MYVGYSESVVMERLLYQWWSKPTEFQQCFGESCWWLGRPVGEIYILCERVLAKDVSIARH